MLKLAAPGLEGLPVTLEHANFGHLRQVLNEWGVERVDAVVADLGFCTDQLEDPTRGLSFQVTGPLDMRLDQTGDCTAGDLLQGLPERELADLFWEYGEERFSRRIARTIVNRRRERPVESTDDLAELVRRSVPRTSGRAGIHPATRVFQALRIAVNRELEALDQLLASLPGCLKPGGKAAIISFHSLEDRRVKRAFREKSLWNVLTRKPVTAAEDEVETNPRARSAKLRGAALKETASPSRP
jgi:16S rRNA (cytosine1402-N4)-methyltransferase